MNKKQRSIPPEMLIVSIVLLVAALIGLSIYLASSYINRNLSPNIPPQTQRFLIDFSLVDQTGKLVNRSSLSNQFLVVNFVFTSCTISCLEVNRAMSEIQSKTLNYPDVRLISISIDPQSDTPAMLLAFGKRFNADPKRWLFLSGEKEEVHSLISTSFLGPGNPKLASFIPGGWIGTDRIAIVDRTGKVRAFVKGLGPKASERVIAVLERLQRE